MHGLLHTVDFKVGFRGWGLGLAFRGWGFTVVLLNQRVLVLALVTGETIVAAADCFACFSSTQYAAPLQKLLASGSVVLYRRLHAVAPTSQHLRTAHCEVFW
jgi:hypothetical protein